MTIFGTLCSKTSKKSAIPNLAAPQAPFKCAAAPKLGITSPKEQNHGCTKKTNFDCPREFILTELDCTSGPRYVSHSHRKGLGGL